MCAIAIAQKYVLQVQRQLKEDSRDMAHTLTATEMGWVANEHEETWQCWTR